MKIYLNEIITTYNNNNIIFRYYNNQNSFLIIANSAYYFTNLNLIFFYFVSTEHIIISIITYIFSEYNYNIIVLMISTLLDIIYIKIVFMNYACYIMLLSTTLLFIKYKQDDIIKSIRFTVLWRNKVRLYDNLQNYHQFTRLVDKFSKLINVICGIIYSITPFFI